MKILVDASVLELRPTGVAKVLIGLYEHCAALRPGLTVEAVHRGALTIPIPEFMRDRLFLSSMNPLRWKSAGMALAAGLMPAIVHYPWNGGVGAMLPWTRVVVTMHDLLPLRIPGFFPNVAAEEAYRRDRQRDLARANLIMTDSEFSRRDITRQFNTRVDPVVVSPASLLKPGEVKPHEAKTPYFIYVGGYDRRKGLEELLSIFIGLHNQGETGSRLVLVGEPHRFSKTFTDLVEEGRRRGIVEETGYVDDTRLASLLAGARGLLYPSRYEGFGLPPLEAMTVGCPVLTTRETSIPEVCGEAAVYADPAQPESFGRTILTLDRDPELRARLAVEGREQAKKFDWRASAQKYLNALDRLQEGRP